MFVATGAALEHGTNHQQRKQPQRKVDVENPAPGGVLHDKPADQRPDYRRQTEHAAKQPLIAATLSRWNDIRDRGHADHHQATTAQPLQGAHQHQLGHILCQSAKYGTGQKQHDRNLQDDFTAKQIAKFAVQRHRDGRTQDIGGDYP